MNQVASCDIEHFAMLNILPIFCCGEPVSMCRSLKNLYKRLQVKSNFKSKKAKIRSRYSQVLHLTQDTTWESDKTQETSHTRVPRGSPFNAVFRVDVKPFLKIIGRLPADHFLDPQSMSRIFKTKKKRLSIQILLFDYVSTVN